MTPTSSGPVRTCVGCRRRAAKHELLRVVAGEGELVPDPTGRAPGRGAHLHPTSTCLELALRRRAFGRALRITGGPEGGLDSGAVAKLVHQLAEAAEAADAETDQGTDTVSTEERPTRRWSSSS
jgi:uncharacterized protein